MRNTDPNDSTERHTKEDALSDREYQLLIEGAQQMRDYYGQHARFIILVAGRLGVRAGEIAHMKEDWIDWRRNMIEIPRHEECTKGRDGGICGYCNSMAEQIVEYNENVTIDDARKHMWSPKTESAVREIPFDFDPRTELVIERFFDRYEEFPISRQGVNRRVNKAAELANELDKTDIYPHCLRSTAASHHAARGLGAVPLKSLMGWSCFSTAKCYIAESGENTARALKMTHSQ